MKKMGIKFTFMLLMYILLIRPSIAQTGKSDDNVNIEKNKKAELENFQKMASSSLTWGGKIFSIGAGAYSGIGIDTQQNSLDLGQLNMRFWMKPSFEISFHHHFITNYLVFFPTRSPLHFFNPIYLNVGYGNSQGNLHWYIEGGGGFNIPANQEIPANTDRTICDVNSPICPKVEAYKRIVPVININAGMEWLVLKNYALGFMVTAATTFSDFSIFLSLTANIVL